jgi:dUTP pyrophosphatase
MGDQMRVQRLRATAKLPVRAHPGDAGADLFADLGGEGQTKTIAPQGIQVIPTGVAITPPEGTAGILWDKSGLARNDGLTILGGLCDRPYTGEYEVIVANLGVEPVTIRHHQKITQVVTPVLKVGEIVEVEQLDETDRGAKGFGSSGKF